MRWDERQRAMLAEMGLRLWPAGGDAAAAPAGTGAAQALTGAVAAEAAASGAAVPVARSREGDGRAGGFMVPAAAQPGPAAAQPVAWAARPAVHGTLVDRRVQREPGVAPASRNAAAALGPPAAPDAAAALDPAALAPDAAAALNPAVAAPDAAGAPAPAVAAPDAAAAPAPAVAAPHAAAALAALAAVAAVCTACALCAGRTRAVFDSGPAAADWMVVGDAPDADDDGAGAPFAGAAGQLLDNMLHAIDLTRAAAPRARRAYVTQSVKCRPPGQRAPEPAELECCARFLQGQIEQVQPRIILAMGRSAAQALLRSSEPFGRLRGQVHRRDGIPVVVTAAPAYLLRHPEAKAAAWSDLCLAQEAVRG